MNGTQILRKLHRKLEQINWENSGEKNQLNRKKIQHNIPMYIIIFHKHE